MVKNFNSFWAYVKLYFRVFQLAGQSLLAGAAAASGTLTSDATAPADADTVTIGTTVYTYKTALTPTVGEVLIGASAATALDNLKSAVNGTAGAGTTYAAGTPIHPTVTATTNTDTTQLFVAKVAGTPGNAIATTETSAHLAFGAATLTGGTGNTDVVPIGGLAVITLAAIDKPTLATPIAGADDGKILRILSMTAFAHVVSTAANKIADGSGTNGDTLTFGAHVGANCRLVAYGGLWHVESVKNVTLSEV